MVRFGGVRRACAALKHGVNATLSVPVLSTDQNELCFIAGQGFDAFLLDDYKRQAKATQNTIIGPLMRSVGGYFFAMALRTLPAYLRRKRQMRVKVEALSKCAYVDPRRGDAAIPSSTVSCTKGARRSRAPARRLSTAAACASSPSRAPTKGRLPSEDRGHVALALRAVYGIFKGTYRHDTLALDFVGDDLQVTLLDYQCVPPRTRATPATLRAWRISVAGNARFVDLLGPPAPLSDLGRRSGRGTRLRKASTRVFCGIGAAEIGFCSRCTSTAKRACCDPNRPLHCADKYLRSPSCESCGEQHI